MESLKAFLPISTLPPLEYEQFQSPGLDRADLETGGNSTAATILWLGIAQFVFNIAGPEIIQFL